MTGSSLIRRMAAVVVLLLIVLGGTLAATNFQPGTLFQMVYDPIHQLYYYVDSSGNVNPVSVGGGKVATPGGIVLSPNCNSQPNCYTVNWNTRFVTDASFTDGSPDIATGSGDPAFTNADVGKVAFATQNCVYAVNPEKCNVGCPVTTIQSVTDSHHVVLADNCTATSGSSATYLNKFAWGNLDDAGIAAAWTAYKAAGGGSLQLPCGAGTSGMISQPMFINSSPTGPFSQTLSISGCGPGTMILVDPSFNFAGCDVACFLENLQVPNSNVNVTQISTGNLYRNFTIEGLGWPTCSSSCSDLSGIYVEPQATLQNVRVDGWIWEAGAGTAGVQLGGGLILDGGSQSGGDYGVIVKHTAANTGYGTIMGSGFINGGDGAALYVDSTDGPVNSFGMNYFADTSSCNSGDLVDAIVVSAGTLRSNGDSFGNMCTHGGTVYLNGSQAYYMGGISFNGSVVHAHDVSISGTGIYNGFFADSATTFYDECGNTEQDYFGLSGTVIGSCSITGVAQTGSNVALTSGWGTASVSAVSGFTNTVKFTVSVTGGSPGANPVITETFPTPASSAISQYLAAPIACTIQQIGGSFGDISNPVPSSLSTSGVAFTFSGTPISGHSYIFLRSCN